MAFGDERVRLLRQEDWTAPGLAQELFAMMAPDIPNTTQSPVAVNLPSEATVAPFQIQNGTDDQPVFSIKKNDGTPIGTVGLQDGQFIFTDPNGLRTPMGGGSGGTTVPVWG
jgi:hypothetical protein